MKEFILPKRIWLAGLITHAIGIVLCQFSVESSGLYRHGIGASSMSMGGAVVASPVTPLQSIGNNPSGLAQGTSGAVELGLTAGLGEGDFLDQAGNPGSLAGRVGVLGDVAVAYPLGESGHVLGLGSYVQSGLRADWGMMDPLGGLDGMTTLGRQRQRSEILLHRTALALGTQLGPRWAIGGSVGLVYNQNELKAPYVFQSHAALAGIKTGLDLETDGFGADGMLGLTYRPAERWTLGVAYSLPTTIHAHGRAAGDVREQFDSLGGAFATARSDFIYDATVVNEFPQIISCGISWTGWDRWRMSMQIDWYDWSAGFGRLGVDLRNGNNADINAFVGSTSADDSIPLNWEDRFACRWGVEHQASESLQWRAGYVYSPSPVPDQYLLPLLAVVSEHTLAVGFSKRIKKTWLDLGYQVQLPSKRAVGTSRLLGNEFDGSKLEISIHWVSASVRFGF